MRKWEEIYNKTKPKIDEEIKKQEDLINGTKRKMATITTNTQTKEYKQLKITLKNSQIEKERLSKLKINISKISNILQFRDKVEERLNEYYTIKDIKDKVDENSKKIIESDNTILKIEKEISDMKQQLKDETGDKKTINEKITTLSKKYQELFNNKIKLNKENLSLNEGLEKFKYGNLDDKTIDEKIQKLGATIVKCNMACSKLMEGKKIDDITFDETKHKYTRKKKVAQKGEKTEEIQEEREMEDIISSPEKYRENEKLRKAKQEKNEEKARGFKKVKEFFNKLKNIMKRRKNPELPEITVTRDVTHRDVNSIEMTDEEMDKMASAILKNNDALESLAKDGTNKFMDRIKLETSKEEKIRLAKWREENGYGKGDTGAKNGTKGKISKLYDGIDK